MSRNKIEIGAAMGKGRGREEETRERERERGGNEEMRFSGLIYKYSIPSVFVRNIALMEGQKDTTYNL